MIEKGDLVKIRYEIRSVDGEKVEEKETETLVGFSFIYPFIEEKIVGLKEGKYEMEFKAQEAFGEKDPSLIQIIPMRFFRANNVKPKPGMFIDVDGSIGKILSVSGGRVIVDFNHPLAGKDVKVMLEIKEIKKDIREKISFLSKVILGKDVNFNVEDRKVKIHDEIPEGLKEIFVENVRRLGYEVEIND